MEKIKCTIERITFQNPENGYSVLQTTIKGYREEQTVVLSYLDMKVCVLFTVDVMWSFYKHYASIFMA